MAGSKIVHIIDLVEGILIAIAGLFFFIAFIGPMTISFVTMGIMGWGILFASLATTVWGVKKVVAAIIEMI